MPLPKITSGVIYYGENFCNHACLCVCMCVCLCDEHARDRPQHTDTAVTPLPSYGSHIPPGATWKNGSSIRAHISSTRRCKSHDSNFTCRSKASPRPVKLATACALLGPNRISLASNARAKAEAARSSFPSSASASPRRSAVSTAARLSSLFKSVWAVLPHDRSSQAKASRRVG